MGSFRAAAAVAIAESAQGLLCLYTCGRVVERKYNLNTYLNIDYHGGGGGGCCSGGERRGSLLVLCVIGQINHETG